MNNIDISFIIPAFNSEKTIGRLLTSIKTDSSPSCEIIITDDCSSDNTFEILKDYERKNSNIHVFKNPVNSGSSVTRNNGLDKAHGKYIFFVDADDEIIWQGIKDLYACVEKGSYDIVLGTYKRIEAGKTYNIGSDWKSGIVKKGNKLYNTIKTENIFGYAPIKLIKKDFLEKNDIRFEKISLMEDQLFNLKMFAKSPSYYFCNSCCYIYYIYENTQSHKIKDDIAENNSIILGNYYKFLIDNHYYERELDLFVPLAMRLLCWSAFKNIPYEGAKYKKIKKRLLIVSEGDGFQAMLKHRNSKNELRKIPSKLQQIFYGLCFDLVKLKLYGMLALIFTVGAPLMKKYTFKVLK